MSIGFVRPSGSLVATGELSTVVFPYWPTTRIDRPSGVVTALMVSLVARLPGLRKVCTWVGFFGSCTLTTATPPPAGGEAGASGAMALDGPDTYAHSPAHALLA